MPDFDGSDWDTLEELWADMKKFAQEHPNHVFLCADHPPRLGWMAFLEVPPGYNEQAKSWTITLDNVKKHGTGLLGDLALTARGRREQLSLLRPPPPSYAGERPSRFERILTYLTDTDTPG